MKSESKFKILLKPFLSNYKPKGRNKRELIRLCPDHENNALEFWSACAPLWEFLATTRGSKIKGEDLYVSSSIALAFFLLAEQLPGWEDPDAPEFAPRPVLGYWEEEEE